MTGFDTHGGGFRPHGIDLLERGRFGAIVLLCRVETGVDVCSAREGVADWHLGRWCDGDILRLSGLWSVVGD